MDLVQYANIMTIRQYNKRYKNLLKKEVITKYDLKNFNSAVEHYKKMHPDWERYQQF